MNNPVDPPPPSTSNTETDRFYDSLATLAVQVLGVPVSFVTFVESHRQVFRGRCTIDSPLAGATETPISHSICQLVAASSQPLIINDTRQDHRLSLNLAVTELDVIAYAGVPIFDEHDQAIGAFCAIDHVPREWSPDDVRLLLALASQVSNDFRHLAQSDRLQRSLATLQLTEAARIRNNRYDRHDLRSPLNALLLSVQAIRELGDVNDDQRECIEAAMRNGDSLLTMIDNMLDLSILDDRGEESLKLDNCPAVDLVNNAIDQVRSLAADKSIQLTTTTDTTTTLRVDKDRITRVLVNLLSNAIKFTPHGGSVTLITADQPHPSSPRLRFSVTDTGIGIAPQHLAKVFEEGFMADATARTRTSTGLGLSFCHKVVQAHGCQLTVTSTLGKGSTFSFTLPVS